MSPRFRQSFWQFALLMLAASGFAVEPDLLAPARRALAESIPQVAIQKLEALRARDDLSTEQRHASALLLGEALLAAHQHDVAASVVDPLTVAGDAAAQLLHAHIFAGAGRWEEALPIYERLARPASAPAAAQLGLAESWQATGQTARAIRVLEDFVQANPRATTAQLRLAGLLAEARQAGRARAVLATVRAETPGDRLWQRYLEGRLLLLDDRPEEAAAAFLEVTSATEALSENLLVAATLAITDARIALSGAEVADRVLEGFIWKYKESAYLELVFRRLDQVYALEKNPPEGELQKWAAAPEPRRAALARFYVARMQLRARKFDRATVSTEAFVGRFRDHPLLPQVHIMRADIQIERRQYANAVLALEAAERHAKTEELRAEIELRAGLVHYQQGEYLLAANKLESAARRSPQLRRTAIYDAALATLRQGNYARFFELYRDLTARYPESELRAELILEEGLLQARTADTRAEETLQLFLLNFPKHPRQSEARLALAELAFQAGDQPATARYLRAANEGPRTPQTDEQAKYLAIFFEEKKTPPDDARMIDLARQFILVHPASALIPEVRLKLGQVYFRNEDFANAETQFATLATENQGGPYAENALFLAGQSAMRTINTGALDRALELFDRVVKMDGPLKLYARQQQAIAQSQLGKDAEAIKLYDIILAAEPPAEAELRFAALAAKGDNLATLGRKDAQQWQAALLVFDDLAARDAPATWRNRALYKKGQILVQLGRGAEALATYYDVLARSAARDGEYLWYYKAGFEAARIFEMDQQWKSAIGIYEKMAAAEGPRAPEARKRAKDLRLQHFLWE